jgi:hypothetical protein
MPDFPLAEHSETLSKVLSSVLPPRMYSYLAAFLPGFFFEVSIFLGNPQYGQQLIARANEAAHLGRYTKILVAVFLAFVIGHALLLWVGMVHRILGQLYRVGRFLWRRFCVWPLLPVLNHLMAARGWWSRQPWMVYLIRSAQVAAFGFGGPSEGVRKLWAMLVRRLFDKHYGIDLNALEQEEWNALYEASGGTRIIQLPDHLLMLATEALGWGALTAIRFAPTLNNKGYVAFNLFMITMGLLYEWWLLRNMNDPIVFGTLRLRAILRDLKKGKRGTT